MEYKLNEQLCVQIYNYLEIRPSGETGVMFAMLDQSMKTQSIEKQKKEAEDKLRAEIKEEMKPKKVKDEE